MVDKLSDPIGRLMGLRYKSHPWHGVFLGKDAPEIVTSFIEVVSTDTVKYEIDKDSGYLRIDRPQKFSNVVPALYGFLPQTFCGEEVGEYCMQKSGKKNILGDGDPLDICVLTEKTIAHGDILVNARPIGGFRMIDGKEADDKIIAVLSNDVVYGHMKDISECPDIVIKRLEHYFLTYKDMPGMESNTEVTHTYGVQEAYEVIRRSMRDYQKKFDNLGKLGF
ncbi:MAG: inorganic pyrophosphatase [Bacteroidetes bacterium GWF2_42_66]|nr:MAG: inorganic pyrophosphatase [Bacteroidetes bacterium GWA2_42_15]OFY00726.1 MAG: inorganic pyrophosphatase [Bacteroidetes bacterium GWE2_42_39]OFY40751.1 MAG: inorganic pyrophosphatase [Bacteroidetes bacterium GWF2_42_66]HBL75761.1 inorganic pyrophosphatase [Prolixibacteraceae bacterium]HCR89600.1 inorganic pyrophosphatase [Prolixibacteraceae bacterium]